MAASNRNGFNIKNNANTVELSIQAAAYQKPGKLKDDIEKILAELTKAALNCKTLTLALHLDNIDYEDQLALQVALLKFIETHLNGTQTLNVLNLEGWDIKLVGKENNNNLTQKKINDHKNTVLRKLGTALAKNKSVTSLSLVDGGFTQYQFDIFFISLDELEMEPNTKLSLKALNIAGHALASVNHINQIQKQAERHNMELILKSEPKDHPSQPEEAKQPHAPYPQWVPNSHNSDRPKRNWRTYLKRMVGFTAYFGAGSLVGGLASFFISAGIAQHFLAGATITLLGVSLSGLGIGLLIAGAIIVGGLIAGAAYGLYRAEKEYQESVGNYDSIKWFKKDTKNFLNAPHITFSLNDRRLDALDPKALTALKSQIASPTTLIQAASGSTPQQNAFIKDYVGAERLKFTLLSPTANQPTASIEEKSHIIQMDNPNQPPSLGT